MTKIFLSRGIFQEFEQFLNVSQRNRKELCHGKSPLKNRAPTRELLFCERIKDHNGFDISSFLAKIKAARC